MLFRVAVAFLSLCLLLSSARAAIGPDAAQKLYERVTPSLVAVKYTWESELGRRELAGAGVVVREDGLVMCQLALFDMRIPDDQLKEFKIIVPDPAGGDADGAGRHPARPRRAVQPRVPAAEEGAVGRVDVEGDGRRKWAPIKFEDVAVQRRRAGPVGRAAAGDGRVQGVLRGERPCRRRSAARRRRCSCRAAG